MPLVLQYFYRFTYYYSLAFGLLRFEYDFHRGNVRPTFRVALYALLSNLLIVSLLPQQFKLDIVGIAHNSKARDLFQFLYVSLSLARSVACVLILALYWWRRHDVIALIIDFQRLVRVRAGHFPHSTVSVRRFRYALLRKLLFICATDMLRFLMAWHSGKWRDQQSIILMTIYFALLSQVVNHFFFGMCVLNFYLEALNEELQSIVDAVALLAAQRRLWPHNFPRRCARLINQFNELMATRQKLLCFADRLTVVLGAQSGCVIFVFYLYNVSMVYLLYSLTKPHEAVLLDMPPWAITCFLIVTAIYCADTLEVLFAFQRLQKNFARSSSFTSKKLVTHISR
ncbi:putative gustatory receptor 36c [Zeugodacus cucurbitae]|uniref:putative gustatory receptor 36c n=1 Tax=Zeugodacus cucurbitae TaxID=28588 RepID=UPI0023D8EBA5|nr:putative gustatory receptor 36c [Zeugodacus cucurbitae]